MMRFLALLLPLLLLLPGCSHVGSQRPLLRSGEETYTLQDLRTLVRITHSPLDQVDLSDEGFDAVAAAAEGRVRELLTLHEGRRRLARRHAAEIAADNDLRMRAHKEVAMEALEAWKAGVLTLVEATPEEAASYHRDNLAELYTTPEQFRLALIYRATSGDAAHDASQRRLLEELLERPDIESEFESLAREHSQSPSAERGGDLGWIRPGSVHPALEKAALEVPPPGVARRVVQTPRGYFLVRHSDHRTTQTVPLEAVQAGIQTVLTRQRKEEALRRAAEDLKGRYGAKWWQEDRLPDGDDVVVAFEGGRFTADEMLAGWQVASPPATPEDWAAFAEAVCLPLVALHHCHATAGTDGTLPRRTLQLLEAHWVGRTWVDHAFDREEGDKLEARAQAYFEEHREAYHGVAPVSFDVLAFPFPREGAENIRLVEQERGRRLVARLHQAIAAGEMSWEEAAGADPALVTARTPMLEEYPPDWKPRTAFGNLKPGFISEPLAGNDAHLLFRVAELGTHRLLTWEEAAPQAMNVVRFRSRTAFEQQLVDEVLDGVRMDWSIIPEN